ncbi:MAG: hypothetical protein ABIK91_01260 [Pseudomonadota bacterium]
MTQESFFVNRLLETVAPGELETLIFIRPKAGYMLNVRKEDVMILPWRVADIYSDKFYLKNLDYIVFIKRC